LLIKSIFQQFEKRFSKVPKDATSLHMKRFTSL